jgi:hypothetical protein
MKTIWLMRIFGQIHKDMNNRTNVIYMSVVTFAFAAWKVAYMIECKIAWFVADILKWCCRESHVEGKQASYRLGNIHNIPQSLWIWVIEPSQYPNRNSWTLALKNFKGENTWSKNSKNSIVSHVIDAEYHPWNWICSYVQIYFVIGYAVDIDNMFLDSNQETSTQMQRQSQGKCQKRQPMKRPITKMISQTRYIHPLTTKTGPCNAAK